MNHASGSIPLGYPYRAPFYDAYPEPIYGYAPYPAAGPHSRLVPTHAYGMSPNGEPLVHVLPPDTLWYVERPAPYQLFEIPGWGPTQLYEPAPPGPYDRYATGINLKGITHAITHTAASVADDITHKAATVARDVGGAVKDAGKVTADVSTLRFDKVAHDSADMAKNLVNIGVDSVAAIAQVTESPNLVLLGKLGIKIQMPNEIATDLFRAVESGDLKHVQQVLAAQSRMASELVAYVPAIGTPIAEALSVASSLINGDKPIGVALHMLMTLPPFAYAPPPLPDILNAIIDAVTELAEGKNAKTAVTDVMIYELRQKVLSQLPAMPDALKNLAGQFFDSAIQLLLRRKPIANVAEDLAQKAINNAMPAAAAAIAPAASALLGKIPANLQASLTDLTKNIPVDIAAKLDDLKSKLAPDLQVSLGPQFDDLKKKAVAALAPMKDIIVNHDKLDTFVRHAQTLYADSAANRAVSKNMPPKTPAELQTVYQQGLTSTDYKDIADRQRTLMLYNRPDLANGLKDRGYQIAFGDPNTQGLAAKGFEAFTSTLTAAELPHATALAAMIQSAIAAKKINPSMVTRFTVLLNNLTSKIHTLQTPKSFVNVPKREPDPMMTQPLSYWVQRYTYAPQH